VDFFVYFTGLKVFGESRDFWLSRMETFEDVKIRCA